MSAYKDAIIENDFNNSQINTTADNTENIININNPQPSTPSPKLKSEIKIVDEFTLFKLNEFNLYLKDYYKNKPEDKFNFEPPELQRFLINNFYDNPHFCKNFTDNEVFSLYSRIKFISKSYIDFKFSDKSKNYTNEQICQAVESKFLNHLLPVLRKIHNGITERQSLKNNTNTDEVKPEENSNDKKEQEQRDFQQEINNNINSNINKNIDNNIIANNNNINSNIDTSQNKQRTLTEIIDEQEVGNYTANIANKHNLKFYKQLYKIESDTKTINKINNLDNNIIGEPQTLRDLLGDADIALFTAKYQHRLEHKFNDYKLKHTNAKLYSENLIRSEKALNLKIIATGAGALIAGIYGAPIFMGALTLASATYGIKKLAGSIKKFLNKDEPKPVASNTLLQANNILDISVSDFKELVNDTEFKEGIKHDNFTNSINREQAEANLNKILTEHYYKFNNKKEFYEFSKYFEASWKEFSRQFDNNKSPEPKPKPKQPSL